MYSFNDMEKEISKIFARSVECFVDVKPIPDYYKIKPWLCDLPNT